jgi:hypothetical protein
MDDVGKSGSPGEPSWHPGTDEPLSSVESAKFVEQKTT